MKILEYQDNVAVLRLNRGVTNPLSKDLVDELCGIIGEWKQDPAVESLVLTSANEKFLSIGFDIPRLIGLSRKEFTIFFRSFNRFCLDLYTLPIPTVAAITGHATAGGCILALCCDYRFIAEGKKLMGLNEIKLGVPVPYLPDLILQSLAGVPNAREIMETGEFYPPGELFRMGVVDRVLPLDQVLSRAVEKARYLGSMQQKAYALIKRNRVEEIEGRLLANREEKEKEFIDCWFSDYVRDRLEEAAEKF